MGRAYRPAAYVICLDTRCIKKYKCKGTHRTDDMKPRPPFFLCMLLISIICISIPRLLLARVRELKISEKRAIETFTDYVREVKFSPFQNYFAVTSGDNTVTLYNKTFVPIWKSQGNRKNVGGRVSFSPDEKYMAFTRYKSKADIGILSIEKLTVVQHIQAHSYYVNSVAYSPDGRFLASGASDYLAILWHRNEKEFEKYQVFKEHTKPVNEVLFSPDQTFLISGSDDGTVVVRILEGDRYVLHQVLQHNSYQVTSMSFSPGGDLLATSISNAVIFWKNDSGYFSEVQRITHNSGRCWSLEFSPDGRFLAGAFSNGSVRLWDKSDGQWQEAYNIYRHSANVFDVSFSPDGGLLATGSSDMTAILWDVEGVSPDPVIFLLQLLGREFTSAQKSIIDRITSRLLMARIDESLTAPKDEFETTEVYENRMKMLSSHILRELQMMTEKRFDVRPATVRTSGKTAPSAAAIKKDTDQTGAAETADTEKSSGTVQSKDKIQPEVPQEKVEIRAVSGITLDTYDADTGVYKIEFLGTKGYVEIQPFEARLLKKNVSAASIAMKRELDPDGISYDYSDFTLIHPVNGRGYRIALDENPFKGPVIGKGEKKGGRDVPTGFKTAVAGPSLEIGDVEFDEVFPVFYKYYDEHPIGRAVLYNNGTQPVDNILVKLYIKQYMDNPKLCEASEQLEPGQKSEVSLFGLFTNSVLDISEGNKVSVKITVDYSAGNTEYRREFVDTIRLNNRNAITWDDNRKVSAFVTARDSEVLKFSKNVTGMIKGRASRALNSHLIQAMGMLDALRVYGISYVVDPNTPYREFSREKMVIDFIQFPVQTLQYKAGDCDDLSILYNALLQSVGIKTAFITIPGHILPAFSLELGPDLAGKMFNNRQNLLFREGDTWIPVEITILNEGFLRAWEQGAKEWRENAAQGKAEFYPTEEAWKIYEPVGFQQTAAIDLPDKSTVVEYFQKDLDAFVNMEMHEREKSLLARIQKTGESTKLLNNLGVLYARYGLEEKALEQFDKILQREDYVPALLNAGNIYYVRENYKTALSYYEKAYNKDPANAKALLALSKTQYRLGNRSEAKEAYAKLKILNPELAVWPAYLDTKTESETRASFQMPQDEIILWDE